MPNPKISSSNPKYPIFTLKLFGSMFGRIPYLSHFARFYTIKNHTKIANITPSTPLKPL
jgi:hypothetical protein